MSTALDKLTPLGSAVQGVTSSFVAITSWQPLFTLQSWAMYGHDFKNLRLRHLWRGYGPNLASDFSNQGVGFFAFNLYAGKILRKKELTPLESLAGGVFAGTMSAPLLSFLERFMVLQQVQRETSLKQLSLKEGVQLILKHEGPRGFTKGILPTALRESTNFTCFFGLSRFVRGKDDSLWGRVWPYTFCGVVAGALTTPFNMIKTHMQGSFGPETFTDSVKKIMGPELKVSRLFRGAPARVAMLGCTMSTLGGLSEVLPDYFPGFLRLDRS